MTNERLNILERFGDSDMQDAILEIRRLRLENEFLEKELIWAYNRIIGENDETQEKAGWRAFNGLKKIWHFRERGQNG